MKRLTGLLFFLLTAMLTTAVIFAQAPEAVIREMTGTVELKASGSQAWKAARNGDRIAESTIISTGFKSTAILAVGSSTFMVRPLTRLSLNALLSRDNTETINVGLRTGRVQVDVKPPAGSRTDFTIQTPSATASVRGTSFDIDPVKLKVKEGTVAYSPAGDQSRPVMVSAGQSSQVDSNSGKVANPIAAAEANRSLPSLPGKTSTAGAESGARLRIPQGTFLADVTISAGN